MTQNDGSFHIMLSNEHSAALRRAFDDGMIDKVAIVTLPQQSGERNRRSRDRWLRRSAPVVLVLMLGVAAILLFQHFPGGWRDAAPTNTETTGH